MLYVTQLITRTVFFLLTTLKSIEQLVHLAIVYFHSHILILYVNGVRKNVMKSNFSKIRKVSFPRKTNILSYRYRLGYSFILRIDSIKDLGMYTDCKLHFHRHVDFPFSSALKLLGLIRKIILSRVLVTIEADLDWRTDLWDIHEP
jgi:hypothetical protein